MFMTALSDTQIQSFNAKGGTTAANTDPQAAQERFLKLFVAQLNNQDPLNPMDNAQMTTQMAQINTVTGIQQVNDTLKSMATQLSANQEMQGTTLVGRQVLVAGNQLAFNGALGEGGFELGSAADAVRVDVLGTAGQLLGSVNMGAQTAGVHGFDWNAAGIDPATVGSFKVTATTAGKTVAATPLSIQKVESVTMANGALQLQTASGKTVAYADVKSFM